MRDSYFVREDMLHSCVMSVGYVLSSYRNKKGAVKRWEWNVELSIDDQAHNDTCSMGGELP